MSTRYRTLKDPCHKETGAVLITGLIFMVVLTIIVISALRSATLEERMAANARNRQLALQAAEAILRDAETTLFAAAPFEPFNPASFTITCTNGLCNKAADGATPRWQTIDWGDTGVTRTFVSADSSLDGVDSAPRYIVEIANIPIGGGGGGICPTVLYRITARGVGSDNSAVILQTMFRHRPTSSPSLSC